MKIKNIIFTLCCGILVVILFYSIIGLNISGPAHYEKQKDNGITQKIVNKYPSAESIYRHSFKYVTYSAIVDNEVYIFDYEGSLVVKKEYQKSMIEEIQELVRKSYGIENAQVHVGYGLNNVVFVVEENQRMIYFDYDTKEVIFYSRGDLI